MSGPQWKIYDAAGTYQAACKEGRAAACLASLYGAGATVRFGHGVIVWREGNGSFPGPTNAFEIAGRLMQQAATEASRAAYDRIHGAGAAAALIASGQHKPDGKI